MYKKGGVKDIIIIYIYIVHGEKVSKLLLQILCFWDRVPLCYLQLTIFLLRALIAKAKLKVYSVTIYKQNYTSMTVDWYYEQ